MFTTRGFFLSTVATLNHIPCVWSTDRKGLGPRSIMGKLDILAAIVERCRNVEIANSARAIAHVVEDDEDELCEDPLET